jgi:hypothetical protein
MKRIVPIALRPLPEEWLQRLFAQQHHREEISRRSIRRLRRPDPELPADHAALELHDADVSAARGDPGRKLEIPGGAAGELTVAMLPE